MAPEPRTPAGASAATRPDPEPPEAYTIVEPETYVEVITLEAILTSEGNRRRSPH
jgi:hypothetical protein